ncbi:hypothetical protein [Photobacterium sanguinicancri]|uniref:hypothetical protein n=1 Tax=Photobacterium sanguinicancri TaxID=875932 RepID=UPI0007870ACD|nr:hypothetical protein [Photobacterium sanguinicancri]KXI24631.1 hypothetical protein AS132_00005 [Photobacterium sanguinicancri]
MEPTFDYFSLKYLNQWLERDSIFGEQLKSDSLELRLKGFSSACSFYGIARNLPKEFDVDKGLRRYEPAVKLLDEFDARSLEQASPKAVIDAQLSFEKELSGIYGGDRLVSLVTKILWLRYQTSVVIYDSRAKNTLGFRGDDLAHYTVKWLESYNQYADQITQSCLNLKSVVSYTVNPKLATTEYVSNISNESWFKERVFDMYLWHHGG